MPFKRLDYFVNSLKIYLPTTTQLKKAPIVVWAKQTP